MGARLPALAEPIDPVQRHLAERRLIAALRRHQRRAPLRPDLRVDTLVAEVRAGEPPRSTKHRGHGPLALTDAELRAVVDAMVESGTVLRTGHRVQLADGGAALDEVMRERVDSLLAMLTAAGAQPPPVGGLAARLGIPGQLVDQLRAAGDLVSLGPRIEVTRESWEAFAERLDRLAHGGELTVSAVRDTLETTRRVAEAILRHRDRVRHR